MRLNNYTTKDYTELGRTYQLVLPLSLEGLVPDDDSVRLLSHELEDLIYSSRKIENACRRDINFMWLLAGQKAPDHSTIARFRTGFLAEACEDLFYQMVRNLAAMGELSCEECKGCPYKEKCTKAKGNKRLYVSKEFIRQRQQSYENIMSETGILYRMNRSIQVEGAFGVLKNDYEFQRFLLKGKTKVKLEILLLCFGYNINKLHAKIQNERTGTHFFKLKTA